mgnify:CR=1 FL=1
MLDQADNYLPAHREPAPAPLFESTSEAAGRVAARYSRRRYRQILAALHDKPRCILEIADLLGCFDHQISGRFGELVKHGLITRTGLRRKKETTGCSCEQYTLTLIGQGVAIALSNPVQTPVDGGAHG